MRVLFDVVSTSTVTMLCSGWLRYEKVGDGALS